MDRKPTMFRLSPDVLDMLKEQKMLQRRSMASIVEYLIRGAYGNSRHTENRASDSVRARLDQLVGVRQ